MYIGNKQLYLENGSLRLRLDTLCVEPDIGVLLNFQEEFLSRVYYSDKQAVIDTLDRKILRDEIKINAIIDSIHCTPCKISGASVSYRLPKDPRLLFEFLLTVDLLQDANNFDSHHFNDFSLIEEMLEKVKHGESIVMQDYLEMGKLSAETHLSKLIAEKILSIGKDALPDYEACYDALKTIYEYSQKKQVEFSACLHIKQRFAILMGFKAQDLHALSSPEIFQVDKLSIIFQVQRKLLAENRKNDLNDLIAQLELEAKKALYAPCIDKAAHDKGKYHWKYTEWYLIKSAEFNIRSDGKMSIKVKRNPDYIKHYSPGSKNYDVMEAEFKHLGKIIGLEFDEKNNFHQEIIFTKACTEKLMALGLHYNQAYLKKLTALKNTLGYFKQAQTDWKDKNVSYLSWLPPEIFKIVLDYSGYHFDEKLNQNKEEIATQRLAWPQFK